MNEELLGIEFIVPLAAWFLAVLGAFFVVGPVRGIIAILVASRSSVGG